MPTQPSHGQLPPQVDRSRVLIVEDEAVIALDMSQQLVDLGYQVVDVAITGPQAIDMARHHQPDVILMDIRLRGGMDGIEVADHLRREMDTPVIYLTSHSDAETVRSAAETAPYGYLTKPFQIKELRAAIEVALVKATMQRQLDRSDHWFASTLRCVQDSVLLVSMDHKIKFINDAAERMLGYELSDIAGRELEDFFKADANGSKSDIVKAVSEALMHGVVGRVDHGIRVISRNGDPILVDQSTGPINDDCGRHIGAVVILRDAKPRLQLEAKLRASEARFHATFNSVPLGMALVTLSGQFLQVNEALAKFLGIQIQTLKQHSYASVVLSAEGTRESTRLQELYDGSVSITQFERRFRHGNGIDLLPALVTVSMVQDETGRSSALLYQVLDLSEQRLAASIMADLTVTEFRKITSASAERNQAELAARAADKLLRLGLEVSSAAIKPSDGGGSEGGLGEYYDQLVYASKRFLETAGSVLQLLTPSPLENEKTVVNLESSLNEAVTLLEKKAALHGIFLVASASPHMNAFANSKQLLQALVTLGSNGIKYNSEGGQVVFSAAPGAPGRVQLTIEDTGIGMTAEQLARVSQPLEEMVSDHSLSTSSGLGMLTSRLLVLNMGGTLGLSSEPGVGTRVVLDLPSA